MLSMRSVLLSHKAVCLRDIQGSRKKTYIKLFSIHSLIIAFSFSIFMCMYVAHTCLHVYECVCMGTHVCMWPCLWRLEAVDQNHSQWFTHPIHWVRVSQVQRSPMRPALLIFEASQLVLGIACFFLSRLKLQVGCHIKVTFTCVLEIRILVLNLVWQVT